MPRRVAITIAGAVSLGAYEAGVMYELLEAFRQHNDQQTDPDHKIYVDVITGASAGGMTTAILGQRLLFDGDSLKGPFTNPLYHTWVERIDIRELVDLSPREFGMEWNSLLSSDLIAKIGRECLIDSLAPGAPRSSAHNVLELDANNKPLPLDIGLALTNLDGINYQLPIVDNPDGGFNYTRSDDQMLFRVGPGDHYNLGLWERMRAAAVACGAFPVAFRPQVLKRRVSEYVDSHRRHTAGASQIVWPGPGESACFVYTDGGVLQNQPLGMAKNFVDERVRSAQNRDELNAHCIANDRLYVLVSPHAVKSRARNGLQVNKITIVRILIELFHTYIRQATFHDWIVAEGMNAKIHQFDDQVGKLANQVAAAPALPAEFIASAQVSHVLLPDPELHAAVITRLRHQYSTEYRHVEKHHGPDTAESFLESVAGLEAAAGLGSRDLMKIVAVLADGRTELAGSAIAAFVGFFDLDFRKHDYWVGRVKARLYLQRKDVKRILRVKRWPGECCWGGPTEDGVKATLPNPTKINALPLPLIQQLRPGMRSLLHMLGIRPALCAVLFVAILLILIALIFLGCVAFHCAVWLIHTVF